MHAPLLPHERRSVTQQRWQVFQEADEEKDVDAAYRHSAEGREAQARAERKRRDQSRDHSKRVARNKRRCELRRKHGERDILPTLDERPAADERLLRLEESSKRVRKLPRIPRRDARVLFPQPMTTIVHHRERRTWSSLHARRELATRSARDGGGGIFSTTPELTFNVDVPRATHDSPPYTALPLWSPSPTPPSPPTPPLLSPPAVLSFADDVMRSIPGNTLTMDALGLVYAAMADPS